ncbi:MAG: hypothetical protein PF508_07770 [Spirochaeta sp.]|jgi:hypothetical protein|nr:hypothetical protein [Spirochaeta sp.]
MTKSARRRNRRFRAHLRDWQDATSGTVFRVKVHHDGNAHIVDNVPPGRYRRYVVVEVAASDPFEAIELARGTAIV